MNIYIWDRLSSISPPIYFIGGIIHSLISNNIFGIYFSISIGVFGELFNRILKIFFKFYFPNIEWMKRPDPNALCNFLINKKTSLNWGFPSGHVQISALASTLITAKLLQNNKPNYYIIAGSWAFTTLVAASRIHLKCHNLIQVLAGTGVGIGTGIFSWYISKKLYII